MPFATNETVKCPGIVCDTDLVLDDCETNVYTESKFPALSAKNITITKSDVYVQSKGDAGIWSNGSSLSVSGSRLAANEITKGVRATVK